MATATRRKPVKARPLFTSVLPIGIFRDGKLLKVHQLEDPRNGYMRAFNGIGAGGLSAGPVPEKGNEIPEMPGLHFRLGVFDPKTPDQVKYVGPKFQPCRLDAAAMKLAIDRFRARKPKLSIGVFLEGGDA